jgi:threonine/homoserine/homoserine lactone efflux protein
MSDIAIAPLLLSGFLIGWSVAWPPGPINAEIARRTIAHGFFRGAVVGYGASVGDTLWALAVAIGAGALAANATLARILGWVSIALLLFLTYVFLKGAWQRYVLWRSGHDHAPASRFDGSRAGFVLGAVAALTSPYNLAFWLAIIGRPDIATQGTEATLWLAAGVLSGTLVWVNAFAGSIAVFRRSLDHPLWDIFTHAATAALMLYFAARGLGIV